MNEKNCKINIADVNLSVNWSENNVGVIYNFPQTLDRYNNTHTHPMYEVFFVSSGTFTVITHTKKVECPNSIVIIPPGLTHCTVTNSSKLSVLYFRLERSESDSKTKLFSHLSEVLSNDVTVLPNDENVDFYVKRIAEMQGDSVLSSESLPHLMSLLFADVFLKLAPVSKPTSTEKHRNYVKAIEDYLAHHYNEKVLITDLAKLLYLSPKQVARIIRKEYNCTFSERITSHRLGIACMLLVRSDLEINKIAASVGYEYTNPFYTNFKKAYGMTPSEYRANAERQ